MESMIVVGGGLVGSLLSMFLAKAGYKVDVYDRNPDPRKINPDKGCSINITLCERGFKAIDAVGAGDGVRALCVPCYGRVIHTLGAEQRYQLYGNQQEAIYSIGRHDLNQSLLEAAEKNPNINFYFNQRCLDINLDESQLEIQDTNSKTSKVVKGHRIFGADGAFSAVRQKMQKLKRFNYSQEYWEQGYREFLTPVQVGPNPYLRRNAIHIWPRNDFMLIGFPNIDQSFTLTLHLPFEGSVSHESIKTVEDMRNLFQQYFPDVLSLVEDNFEDSLTRPVGTMVTIRSSPWRYRDKAVLIGDACHAVFPSYGQGANAGFEDCQTLYQQIMDYPEDWGEIFKQYELSRKKNLDIMADLCYDHFNVLRKEVGKRDFVLRDKIEKKILEKHPSLRSLYYNISFTDRSYSESVKNAKEHEKIVDKLINQGDVETLKQKLEGAVS